jgi:SnoaL-like domain
MVNAREAIERVDLDSFAEALTPNVVWVGLWPGELCRNRDDVLEMFARMREQEMRPRPRIVLDKENVLVVDPHLDGRHHVLVLDEGLVSEVRAFPDRASAIAAVEERPW